MTDRDRERVGRIVRRGHGRQTQQQLDHLLHLRLVGAAVADDGAFDRRRRVLDHLAAGLDRRQHRHAASVTELERAARVHRVEQVLDGHAVGLRGAQQRRELTVDAGEPLRKPVGGRRRDGAARHEPVAPTVALDATVAGALGAGVDAEDSHASEASISFSSMSKFAHTRCTSSWSSSISISFSIVRASLPSSLM